MSDSRFDAQIRQSETSAKGAQSPTSQALKNLRAYAIVMVVSFHSVLAYLASQPATPEPFDSPPYHWLATPILDSHRWLGFDIYGAFQYVALMPVIGRRNSGEAMTLARQSQCLIGAGLGSANSSRTTSTKRDQRASASVRLPAINKSRTAPNAAGST